MLDHLTDVTLERPIVVQSDWLNTWWEHLTRPHPALIKRQERRQASLTSALLLLLIVLVSIGVLLGAPTVATLLLLCGSYVLSRTRHVKLAAFIALFAMALPSYAHLLMDQSPDTMVGSLSWLVVPVAMGALILPIRGMITLIFVNIISLLMIKFGIAPDLPLDPVMNTIGLLIVVGGVIIVNAIIQQQYLITPQLEELRSAQRLLQRTNTELEAANQEVKTFAYIIVHDLRAPLVNMMGFMDEVRFAIKDMMPVIREVMPDLTEEQQHTLQTIFFEDLPEAIDYVDTATNKMEYLIEQIMKLSRAGQRGFYATNVNTRQVVDGILATKAFELERRNTDVKIGPLPEVVADKLAMEQVFTNLLDNAVKYLEPERAGAIEISGERDDKCTTYHVKDNGIGIPLENYDQVFQPFRRAVTNRQIRGEGMGLPYVQSLIQKHGGRVWFESELGHGTVFHFSIPHDFPLLG